MSSFQEFRHQLEKKKTLFNITFCNLGREAPRNSEFQEFSPQQIMEQELLLSMRLVITHLLDQPKIAYFLIESNIQRGWLIEGCNENPFEQRDPCELNCPTEKSVSKLSRRISLKSPIFSEKPNLSKKPTLTSKTSLTLTNQNPKRDILSRRNSRTSPEKRLQKSVCIRPMDIDNLFTILARLSKLTRDDELMCTLEDFFDSYGETVLHKQFGNHHYATPLHIICQYHNINLLERCVNRLKNCPFDQDGNHPFHYIGKMKKERLNPEIMKRLAMYAVAFNCAEFLTQIQCTNGESGTAFVERRKISLKSQCNKMVLASRLGGGLSRSASAYSDRTAIF